MWLRDMEGYGGVLGIAYKLLLKYPLCNHCLGRLFAKLGRGLGNDVRGYSIKTLLAMEIHRRVMDEGLQECRDVLKKLALNSGEPFTTLYKHLYGEEVSTEKCIICDNLLSRKFFQELADMVVEEIRKYHATSFLVGVRVSRERLLRELMVAGETSLKYSESIKNEVKREVGKIVRDKYGVEPDFDKPDIVVIIDLECLGIETIVNPVLLYGRYWKKARNISHIIWVSRGVRQYPYSLEEFFNDSLKELYGAERIVLHASGREDVDVRMIGTGRPMVLEIKRPVYRLVSLDLVNEFLNSLEIEAVIEKEGSRSLIEALKKELSRKQKIYKALVYVEESVSKSDLEKLVQVFKNATVKQLTPLRILRRKKEVLRIRKVYEIAIRSISNNLFEVLIKADGGLYIKELISGDNGRTEPSFSSVLGVKISCIELDVVGVEIVL